MSEEPTVYEVPTTIDDIQSDAAYREREASWTTNDQWECCQLLRDLFGGWHHMNLDRVKRCGCGVSYVNLGHMATHDCNRLTRLVLFAHQRMIRLEVGAGGPRGVKITLFKRHTREGGIGERHPTIETAITSHVGTWPNSIEQELTLHGNPHRCDATHAMRSANPLAANGARFTMK